MVKIHLNTIIPISNTGEKKLIKKCKTFFLFLKKNHCLENILKRSWNRKGQKKNNGCILKILPNKGHISQLQGKAPLKHNISLYSQQMQSMWHLI